MRYYHCRRFWESAAKFQRPLLDQYRLPGRKVSEVERITQTTDNRRRLTLIEKMASDEAYRMSQAEAMSTPAPITKPLRPAMTGLSHKSMAETQSWRWRSVARVRKALLAKSGLGETIEPMSLMSRPAVKTGFQGGSLAGTKERDNKKLAEAHLGLAEERTTARTSLSLAACRNIWPSSDHKGMWNAFALGSS
jgi:hypothetical protein